MPFLEFISLESDSLVNAKYSMRNDDGDLVEIRDTILLKFGFRDGDGNLGHSDDDETSNYVYVQNEDGGIDTLRGSIFLADSRTGFLTAYSFPDVQAGKSNLVTGEIEITVDHLTCSAFATDTDTVVYSAYLMDRDSQISNILDTDTILVICN